MNRLNLLEALTDNIKVDHDKCVFCGKCVDTCILDNLRLKLAPCRDACPLGVNAQGYVQLIARGQMDKAREMVTRELPLPEIACRICDAPCEKACHLGRTTGQPVSIRALKRFLFEGRGGQLTPEREPDSGKKTAVVGSGPAGLTAAFDLAVAGHQVTVFEADDKPGGLLAKGIPAFRLPAEVLERELNTLKNLGVTFRTGQKIGRDISLADMEQSFDAVILALGLGGQKRLGVEGEDLPGIISGMELLAKAKAAVAHDLAGRVLVIGGGNAAMDAAQTALRLGAEQVGIVSLEAREELPAFEHEVAQCEDEGIQLNCGWGVTAIKSESGRVTGLELAACTSCFDENGAFSPQMDSSRKMEMEADRVIVAIGQDGGPWPELLPNEPQPDPLTLATSHEKVFAAGDCCKGPGSAVSAMASGRRAAESVKRLLQGRHLSFNRAYAGPVVTDFEIDSTRGSGADRVHPRQRSFEGKGDFAPLEEVFSADQAINEAARCLSCGGPFGKYRTCWFCLPCEVECPEDALWVDVPYLLR